MLLLLNFASKAQNNTSQSDTTKTPSKSTLETTVVYGSKGKMHFNVLRQTMYMYDEAFVIFGNKTLNADVIELSWGTNTVKAYGREDSTGNVKGEPVFTEDQTVYNAKEIIYNYKTEKGLIRGILTEQGDGYVQGDKVKKSPTDEFYISDAVYTTCKAEHPHFAIHSRKLKMVPNKYVISGPFNMEINKVPLPLGFPLGLFPVNAKRSSGIIVPQYGEQKGVGFFLRGGGVYLAVSDYVGVKITGDIYSLGGWLVGSDIQYKKRYYYDGGMNAQYRRQQVQNADGTTTITPQYQFTWNHRPVPRGNGSFSANVSIMSADFRRNNSRSTTDYISATVNSGISYNTNFLNKLFSFSSNLRANQNLLTKVTTVSPDMNLSMQRVFPFKKEGSTKKNLLTDFNFSYGMNAKAEINNTGNKKTLSGVSELIIVDGEYVNKTTYLKENNIKTDTLDLFGNLPRYLKDMKVGMAHNFQASTNMTIFKYFTMSPRFTYNEKWYPEQYRYRWVEQAKGVKIDTLQKLARVIDYSVSNSFQTRFYGFYSIKGTNLQMRQQFAPSVGFSYRPDFSEPQYNMFQQVQVDEEGTTRKIAYTEGGYLGAPSQGKSFSMNFSLSSQLEGKIKQKPTEKDTTANYKKIKLLDNINLSSSYNFVADSFNLDDISMGAKTVLFEIFDINLQGVTLDPYYYAPVSTDNKTGVTKYRRTPTYSFQKGKGLGIIKGATLALGFKLSPTTFKKKSENNKDNKKEDEEENPILADIRRNPDRYVDFTIPWSISIDYNVRYSKSADLTSSSITQTLNFSGDFSLTKNWKITYRSGYDFKLNNFTFTNIGIMRDLHCWTMSVNWVPFGPRQSYTFDLNVKSSILQDLKISKRNDWYDAGLSANASR
ncbi:MAG: putative LPS assembly protein LptD [Flammeovirgaceae bacterium]